MCSDQRLEDKSRPAGGFLGVAEMGWKALPLKTLPFRQGQGPLRKPNASSGFSKNTYSYTCKLLHTFTEFTDAFNLKAHQVSKPSLNPSLFPGKGKTGWPLRQRPQSQVRVSILQHNRHTRALSSRGIRIFAYG